METITKTIESFWKPITDFIPRIPALFLSVIIGYLLIKILAWMLSRAIKFSKIPRALAGIIMSLSLIIMWVILFAEIARQLGMNSLAVTISGSLAVMALALAAGASGMASDIIAGIFLAKDNDFEIGFRIKVGGVEGIVSYVDVRKIRMVDDTGSVHIFPNSKLDKDGWMVISKEVEDNKIEVKKILHNKNKN